MTVRRVVLGLDGSAGAARALEWTKALVAETEAEVIAVHVLTYSTEFRRDLGLETMHAWRHDLAAELDGPWTAPLRDAGVTARVETRLIEGDSASSGLMEVADEAGADLIVVGAQGHGGLADRVLGGASYRLAHRARQPVVVVPPDWVAAA